MTLYIGKLYQIEANGATFVARLISIRGKNSFTEDLTVYTFRAERETFEWSAAEVSAASFGLIEEN